MHSGLQRVARSVAGTLYGCTYQSALFHDPELPGGGGGCEERSAEFHRGENYGQAYRVRGAADGERRAAAFRGGPWPDAHPAFLGCGSDWKARRAGTTGVSSKERRNVRKVWSKPESCAGAERQWHKWRKRRESMKSFELVE